MEQNLRERRYAYFYALFLLFPVIVPIDLTEYTKKRDEPATDGQSARHVISEFSPCVAQHVRCGMRPGMACLFFKLQ